MCFLNHVRDRGIEGGDGELSLDTLGLERWQTGKAFYQVSNGVISAPNLPTMEQIMHCERRRQLLCV